MFQVSNEEYENLRSQFVTSSLNHGGRRYMPFAITEQGVYILATVLKSDVAIIEKSQPSPVKYKTLAKEYTYQDLQKRAKRVLDSLYIRDGWSK